MRTNHLRRQVPPGIRVFDLQAWKGSLRCRVVVVFFFLWCLVSFQAYGLEAHV